MKPLETTSNLQKWGNSLAIRIPANLARKAHFDVGTPIHLTLHDHEIILSIAGKKKLTLDEKLAQFNQKKFGGEIMDSAPIGLEKIK